MEPTVFYTTQIGEIWDWRVATDLFLGGVGVGAFLLAFALWRFGAPRYRALAQTAAVIAPIAVAMGLSLLFWKLGYKIHAYQMGLNIASTSVMWWGAMIQGAFVALSAIFAFRLLFPDVELVPAVSAGLVSIVAVPFAAIIGIYHGALLATITSHAVWATGPMVIASVLLFVLTGASVALLFHMLRRAVAGEGFEEGDQAGFFMGLRPLGGVMMGAAALLLVTLLAWWIDLRFGPVRAREALSALLGEYGMLLGGVGVALGLILPLLLGGWAALQARDSGKPPVAALALACLLLVIGGYAIRYSVVLGAQIAPQAASLATLS